MLKASCRRFREGFSAGSRNRHRGGCSSCAAWAAALETVHAVRAELPLPEPLRQRLLLIPALAETHHRPLGGLELLPLPVSRSLRSRLAAIPGRQAEPSPSVSLYRSRYAVAASYLMVLLLGGAFGDPVTSGQQVSRFVSRRATLVAERAEAEGRARIEKLERDAVQRLQQNRQAIVESASDLAARLEVIVQQLRDSEPHQPTAEDNRQSRES